MKHLLTLMTAILITSAAVAQHGNSPKGHVNIGIKGGVNLYTINNNNDNKYDYMVGYNFGLLGHIHLNKSFGLQPELVYSAQGAKYIDNNATTSINLGYINLPILVQYMFDNGLRLQAGPQVGLLIAAKSKTGSASVDIKQDLKPIDLALSIGASYVYPPVGLGIDARYNLGLTNIYDRSDVISTNRGLQLGLFYIFSHNGK